ncbi:MAG: hypothetical protein JXA96_16765 [Sedimentisphaerales bacterium]|nr:hypothetical protein [Sedimentisphaerales bacterium]
MKYVITLFLFSLVLPQGSLIAENEIYEFVVSPSTDNQENPDIHGDIVVWQQYISEYGDYDVLATDINNLGQPFFSTNVPSDQINPSVFENHIVWQSLIEGEDSADWDIRMTDISDPNFPSYAITNYINNNETNPAIHGNIVVWEDDFHGNLDIFGADVTIPSRPIIFPVTEVDYDQAKPSVYRDKVVWQDSYFGDWDIYAADIWMKNKALEYPVSLVNYDQKKPVISGDTVVWMNNFSGNWNIYAADISDIKHPIEKAISINTWDETNPDIDDNIIVWQAWVNNNWDIFAYNMTTRQTYQITYDSHDQTNPVISGKTIVWQDNRLGHDQIFGAALSDIEAAYCTKKLAADINNDCKVDDADYVIMSLMWLDCNIYPPEACP